MPVELPQVVFVLFLAAIAVVGYEMKVSLQPPFCPLVVARIHEQREGEADLRIVLSSGACGIAQVNAKDQPTDRVGIVKAGSVLQQSPELNPSGRSQVGARSPNVGFGSNDDDVTFSGHVCFGLESGHFPNPRSQQNPRARIPGW